MPSKKSPASPRLPRATLTRSKAIRSPTTRCSTPISVCPPSAANSRTSWTIKRARRPPPGSVEAAVAAAEVDKRFGVTTNRQRGDRSDDDRVIAGLEGAVDGRFDVRGRLVEQRRAVGAKVVG